MLNKETISRRSSSQDQGSSWAMEVGGDLKVCPIIVENINMNGQMLVEVQASWICENSMINSSFVMINMVALIEMVFASAIHWKHSPI